MVGVAFFVLLCTCCVLFGEQLYYKIGTGPVFGPYTIDEILQWERAGFFNEEEPQIASKTTKQFIPLSSYNLARRRKNRSLLKVGSILKKVFTKTLHTGIGDMFNSRPKHQHEHSDDDTLKAPFIMEDQNDVSQNQVKFETEVGGTNGLIDEPSPVLDDYIESSENTDMDEQKLLSQLDYDVATDDTTVRGEQHEARGEESSLQSSASSVSSGDWATKEERISVKSIGNHDSLLWKQASYRDPAVSTTEFQRDRAVGAVLMSLALAPLRKMRHALVAITWALSYLVPAVVRQLCVQLMIIADQQRGGMALLLLLMTALVHLLRGFLFVALAASAADLTGSMPHWEKLLQPHIVHLPALDSRITGIHPILLSELSPPSASDLASSGYSLAELLQQAQALFALLLQQLQALRWTDISSVLKSARLIQGLSVSVQGTLSRYAALLVERVAAAGPQGVQVALVLCLLALVNSVLVPLLETSLGKALTADEGEDGEAIGQRQRQAREVFAAVAYVSTCMKYLQNTVGASALLYFMLIGGSKPLQGALGLISVPLLTATLISLVGLYKGVPQTGVAPSTRQDAATSVRVLSAKQRIRRVQALTAALMNTKVQQACKQTGLADYVQGQLHRATRDLYTAVIALRPETTTAHFCDRQHQHHQHVVSAGINALNRLALVMLVVLVSLAVWGHPAVRQASPSALWGTVEGLGRESAAVRTLFARPMAIVHAAARQLFQASFLSSDILVSSHPSLLSACVLSEAKGLMFLVAVVLLLPSLYTQQQLLGMVRLEAVDITNSAAGKDETDAKGAYLSAREATSTMQEGLKTISEAKSLPQNWLHEINPGALGGRLNVSTGLHLALCNGTLSDAFTTKILSLALPAGKITVVECASQKELATTNAAFQQLTDRSLGTSPSPLQPLLLVDGRALGDWGDEVLREAVVYFSGQEPKLPFQAGAVAGYLPGMTGEELRRALRAQVASGAHAIVSALASGPATVLSAQASGGDMQDSLVGHAVELTADQWRTLHLSRALCHADRSVVLLSDPTRDMSPRQSEPFFQFLREVLRPDQVVAIATTDTSVGALADHVAHLSVERSAGAKFESALLTP